MTWRQQQHARQKGPPFVMLPWPFAEGGVPRPQGTNAPLAGTASDRTGSEEGVRMVVLAVRRLLR
jgi:hypothetical protein